MSAIEVPDHGTRPIRVRRASAAWSVAAAGLFLGSAVLQLVASIQRWVIFRLATAEFVAEDHLYDYSFPWSPWQNVGSAAQLFGAGTLLLAIGVLAMAIAVVAMPRTDTRRPAVVLGDIVGIVLAILVAGSFALSGAHALISGITGAPSHLRDTGQLAWFGVLGPIILGALWLRRSTAAVVACAFLVGSSGLGYLVAAFFIAPRIAGYVSHDTTPWTETVVAMSTAAAGIAMIFVAREAVNRESAAA